jgi:hypothetical protein
MDKNGIHLLCSLRIQPAFGVEVVAVGAKDIGVAVKDLGG